MTQVSEYRELTLPSLDLSRFGPAEVACDVADEVCFGRVIEHLGPESTRLLKVD